MKYVIKDESEQTVLKLTQKEDGILLEDVTHHWSILKIRDSGEVLLYSGIGRDSGLKLGSENRIVTVTE